MLTDRFIQNVKPTEKLKKYAAGDALYLFVYPNGKKVWRLAYRFEGQQKSLSFGDYPQVTLKAARKLRDEAKTLVKAGIDPATKQTHPAPSVAEVLTFKDVCLEWLETETQHCGQNYRKFMLSGLEHYFFPTLGQKQMSQVTASDILAAIAPLQATGKLRGGRRLTDVCGQIWRYAVSTGKIEHDITTELPAHLRSKQIGHHMAATLDATKIGHIILNLEQHDGYFPVGCALRLVPLVFVRSGALRCAEWSEFHFRRKLWIIPAKRMALNYDHIVPLAPQALSILRSLYEYTGQRKYLFPGVIRPDQPIDMSTITVSLRRRGYDGVKLSFDGIRSLAARVLAEIGYDNQLIKMQLAHQGRTSATQKFDSWALLEERTKMMCQWADYLSLQRHKALQAINV